MERSRSMAYAASLAGLTALYFAAGKLGLSLALAHPNASPVWPPTGIALAALLLLGQRVWPAVLVGAFLVNVTTAGSAATSLGIAAGNTLEAIVGAWLVNRFACGRRVFERPQHVFKFVVLAALASTAISATIGVTSLALGGFAGWSDYGWLWTTWWLGDATGALVVTPALVCWLAGPAPRWNLAKRLEAAALLRRGRPRRSDRVQRARAVGFPVPPAHDLDRLPIRPTGDRLGRADPLGVRRLGRSREHRPLSGRRPEPGVAAAPGVHGGDLGDEPDAHGGGVGAPACPRGAGVAGTRAGALEHRARGLRARRLPRPEGTSPRHLVTRHVDR